jgi:hypothetical protein
MFRQLPYVAVDLNHTEHVMDVFVAMDVDDQDPQFVEDDGVTCHEL